MGKIQWYYEEHFQLTSNNTNMIKQPSYIISIPTPCHESWDAMSPAEQGRFCQSCQKTVIDFSTMSDKELFSFLGNATRNICGRFHGEQLNREVSMPVNTRRQPLMPIAAMVAALTVAIPSVKANHQSEKMQMTSDKSARTQSMDSLPHVTGIVKDSIEDVRLAGAIVKIKGHDMQTVTDSVGKFELHIPAGITENTITLEVRYIGFTAPEVVVPLMSKAINIDILMQPVIVPLSSVTMGAVYVIPPISIVSDKRTPWQRFKHNVGQLFR